MEVGFNEGFLQNKMLNIWSYINKSKHFPGYCSFWNNKDPNGWWFFSFQSFLLNWSGRSITPKESHVHQMILCVLRMPSFHSPRWPHPSQKGQLCGLQQKPLIQWCGPVYIKLFKQKTPDRIKSGILSCARARFFAIWIDKSLYLFIADKIIIESAPDIYSRGSFLGTGPKVNRNPIFPLPLGPQKPLLLYNLGGGKTAIKFSGVDMQAILLLFNELHSFSLCLLKSYEYNRHKNIKNLSRGQFNRW